MPNPPWIIHTLPASILNCGMPSQEYHHLNDSDKEACQIDSHGNTSTSECDIEGGDPTNVSLQYAHGDEQSLDGFIQAHPLSTAACPQRRSDCHLSFPVVIPQRRPGNKSRGFVEAYAPALEPFGIQQDEFISFVRATNKAVQASKWLTAIQLAAMGTSFVPNSIAMGASVAVQVVAGVIAKAETRWKYVRVFSVDFITNLPANTETPNVQDELIPRSGQRGILPAPRPLLPSNGVQAHHMG